MIKLARIQPTLPEIGSPKRSGSAPAFPEACSLYFKDPP